MNTMKLFNFISLSNYSDFDIQTKYAINYLQIYNCLLSNSAVIPVTTFLLSIYQNGEKYWSLLIEEIMPCIIHMNF